MHHLLEGFLLVKYNVRRHLHTCITSGKMTDHRPPPEAVFKWVSGAFVLIFINEKSPPQYSPKSKTHVSTNQNRVFEMDLEIFNSFLCTLLFCHCRRATTRFRERRLLAYKGRTPADVSLLLRLDSVLGAVLSTVWLKQQIRRRGPNTDVFPAPSSESPD